MRTLIFDVLFKLVDAMYLASYLTLHEHAELDKSQLNAI